MKKRKFNVFSTVILLISAFAFVLVSCEEDEPVTPDNPVASFQFEVDAANYLIVNFTNYSQNATSYSWAFGDGETSTEMNPSHEYAEAGTFEVVLTASNDEGTSANYSQTIEITDPNEALVLLAGESSKTWKLFREGTSMSLGSGPDAPGSIWAGLTNEGARPCLYYQTFTFHTNGDYVFDDNGMFWGEWGVFPEEVCFEAIPENMVNADGQDVSAWLSGTHSYDYDASTGSLTLNGLGAWIGIPKLGPTGETTIPIASTSCNISIEEMVGYDIMTIVFDYGDNYWLIKYASYSDPSLEPEVVEVQPPFGEDLPDLTPTEMYNYFQSATSFMVLDTAGVYPGAGLAANGMTLTYGVADPAGGADPVGQYDRWGQYQELQFQMQNDIQFDNFTTVSLEVYFPSSNDYSGDLLKTVGIIIGEASQTEQWWTGHTQYDYTVGDDELDQWVTITFNLSEPTSAGMYNPKDRTDLDFFAISLGGGGHNAPGTFYVRNFVFN